MTLANLLVFFLLLCGSAFFSGTETALTSLSEATVQPLAEKGHRRAQILRSLLATRGSVIGAMLIGNNIVNTLLAVYAATVFDALIVHSPLPPWLAPVAAATLSIVVLLIGGEVLPKNIAIRFNLQVALLAAYPCQLFIWLVTPILGVLNLINRAVIASLGGSSAASGPTADELLALVKMSQKAGVIDPMERELIAKAMVLNETQVKDIMMHRTQICAIQESTSLEDLQALFARELYSRLPVYRESLDHITGIINIKEIMRHHGLGKGFRLADSAVPPLVFPETARIGSVFEKMRHQHVHMAVIVDEYGTTTGLVTLEDIIEQIFGEISDEYDQHVVRLRWLHQFLLEADGRTSIVEFQTFLREKGFPALQTNVCEDVDTLAGLILRHAGNVPVVGAAFDISGYRFQVRRVTGQKIQLLTVQIPESATPGPDPVSS